jgi:hypothetical protein
MSLYHWQFGPKFRRGIFGWRSQTPIKRIKEATFEIRKIARKDTALAAEGAVLFLEKISPALEKVDSSSGAIGSAVNSAIEILVPIISKATVADKKRQQWLERLWEAIQNDDIPYIEHLGEFWGELCTTPEIASFWADRFIDLVNHIWSPKTTGHGFFKGTTLCLSALFSAKRYNDLLELLDGAKSKRWGNQRWGIKALVAMGCLKEALEYAKNYNELDGSKTETALICEEILIAMGRIEEAYDRYALEANKKMTNLATFRAITKKYPHKSPLDILQRLIASQPEEKGKWFAAAKDAGFFELAIELVNEHPADPRTLIRAAKEFAFTKPDFAIASGIASLHWIIYNYGYEITTKDVLAAYFAIMEAASAAGILATEIKTEIGKMLIDRRPNSKLVEGILMPYLTN